jgi:hypothetical protein
MVFQQAVQTCAHKMNTKFYLRIGATNEDSKAQAPVSIAVIADPQLTDDTSYPHIPSVVRYLAKIYCDLYAKKARMFLQSILKPQYTLFLGDMFDGSRFYSDEM